MLDQRHTRYSHNSQLRVSSKATVCGWRGQHFTPDRCSTSIASMAPVCRRAVQTARSRARSRPSTCSFERIEDGSASEHAFCSRGPVGVQAVTSIDLNRAQRNYTANTCKLATVVSAFERCRSGSCLRSDCHWQSQLDAMEKLTRTRSRRPYSQAQQPDRCARCCSRCSRDRFFFVAHPTMNFF